MVECHTITLSIWKVYWYVQWIQGNVKWSAIKKLPVHNLDIEYDTCHFFPDFLIPPHTRGPFCAAFCFGLLKGLLFIFHFLFVGEVFFIQLLLFLLWGFQWLLLTPFRTRHGVRILRTITNSQLLLQPFDPRTVQPVASRYTDWANRPTLL